MYSLVSKGHLSGWCSLDCWCCVVVELFFAYDHSTATGEQKDLLRGYQDLKPCSTHVADRACGPSDLSEARSHSV